MIGNYLFRCIGFAIQKSIRGADALSILAALAIPAWYWWKDKPMPENILGFYAFCILAVIAAFILVRLFTAPYFMWKEDQKTIKALEKKLLNPEKDMPNRTILRLQFYGDLRFPTAIEEENIFSWFAYRRDQLKVDVLDAGGNLIEKLALSPMWCISIILKDEQNYKSVDLNYRSSDSIQAQVRQTTLRSIFVVIEDDMPAEQFEIKTIT